jgi:hypothetical protein
VKKHILLCIIILAASTFAAHAATKISARSGGFNRASTWTDNLVPEPGDDIIIQAGHGVSGSGVVGNLTVRGSLTNMYPGFTVNGDLRVENGAYIDSLSGYMFFNGANCTNDGTISVTIYFNGDEVQSISGAGIWNANGGEFNGGTKMLADVRMIKGTWTVNSRVIVGSRWQMTNGKIAKSADGIIEGAGRIEFEGAGYFSSNESTGNLWSAPVVINSGTRGASGSSGISAPVLVKSGTTLSALINVTLNLKDDVIIENGAKVSGQAIQFSGTNITNNGEVFPVTVEFKRDGDQAIAGGGAWRGSNNIFIRGSGTKSLLNSITTNVGTVSVESALNVNEHTLTVNAGTFAKPATGKITGTGKIASTGNGYLNSNETTGNLWLAPLEIATGTRTANSTSSFSAPVTVKSGAVLSTVLNVTIHAREALTLEAGGSITGANLELYNGDFVNNGAVKTVTTYFNGTNTLSGTTGSFGGNGTYIESGASVTLVGVQQFVNLTVRTGGTFDITNSRIKISGVLSVAGTLTTIGSTIEFNGTTAEQSIPRSIDYYNLTINNSREVNLGGSETVQNILLLERGIFNIATNRLTIGSCGQIVYVNGVLSGTPIYPPCVSIAFVGDTPRNGVSLPPSVNTLRVQNSQPVVLNQNLTVTERLELYSDLATGNFILTMPAEAVSGGTADVVGNVRRTGIVNETAYSFGNPYNTIRFDGGTPPTEATVNLTKNAPADFPEAIARTYGISSVGGVNYAATLRLHYLDSELNANSEYAMQFFNSDGNWTTVTAASRSAEENWLEVSGVSSFSSWTMGDLAPNFARTTAAIGGRITTFESKEESEVFVDLTDSKGTTRRAQTNSSGDYRFDDIPVGETYILNVRAKNYQFVPRVVYLTQAIENLNFTAE